MRYAVLLASVIVLLAVCLGSRDRVRAGDWTDTPPADTGTPWLETQYPSETPSPDPTATYVTPTSPPPATDTPGVTPDPMPTETDVPERHPRKTPTVIETLPVTGGGDSPMLPIWAGIFLGMVAFMVGIVRRARDDAR